MKTILTLILTFMTTLTPACLAEETAEKVKQSEEYKIGVMVKAITAALKAPENPASLKTITGYGTDSRYYVMIRGWLIQEKRGTESQLNAIRDPEKKVKFQQKFDFLNQCVRRIDLE